MDEDRLNDLFEIMRTELYSKASQARTEIKQVFVTQQTEIERLRESLEEIRDLCRTGVAPDSWDYTETEWLEHKVNKSARIAATALENKKWTSKN